jgi:hypothetical protein
MQHTSLAARRAALLIAPPLDAIAPPELCLQMLRSLHAELRLSLLDAKDEWIF